MEQEEESRRAASIFLYLPVKTLLRCRCLSRCHMSTIDNPNFSVLYGISSAADHTRPRNLYLDLFLDRLDTVHPVCSFAHLAYSQQVIIDPQSTFCGSCFGLLCSASSPFDVCLWNPSTRTHRHIIALNYEHHDTNAYRYVSFGLGRDSQYNNKLVCLVFFLSPETLAYTGEASVYSLRTDT